ncbi:MAG: electron transport complex subunit RsxE [Actinobacteria bacterium]|nr:electron transport complex subunit RsxE [Actinomycetota bacterium]MBU4240322.1 electron transport complex subunit RsxE [Actinomycetota bacterium]MBU4386058.1 electron transport complex subunit RsxE [Actinomycetota bacterium]MBU4489006.1 electron transport complex subunit RsxE [Actinomycetota bacterium]MCG2796066.1 electron transport complex subunit RsxE [Actinomycetes bacterium]
MDDGTTLWDEFKKGVITENALLKLMVGLCSALAVSNRLENGIFMGIAATFVLVCSNILIALIRERIPYQIRIPIFIIIIASFVTVVDLVMKAYVPVVYERLGVWIPLIVVNCMILARAEGYASKNSVAYAAVDGLGIGVGYTLVLLVMGFVRELLGTGKIILFEKTIVSLGPFNPPLIFVMFPGAFLTFGIMMALLNRYESRKKQ